MTTFRTSWNRLAARADSAVVLDVVLAMSRLAIAAIFFYSGRTKVDGLLGVTDGAVALFRDEYQVPIVDPALVAHAAAYAEHLFPLLLVLGFMTRPAAIARLGMTLVIQFFVYPAAWPTHLSWAALLVLLLAKGAGRWSVDRRLGLR